MTDLLHVLPDFPIKSYTHLLPSLEKHLVTTTDLLTLDALEIAKRAQLPLLDVRRLARHVTTALHGQLGVGNTTGTLQNVEQMAQSRDYGSLKQNGCHITSPWAYISTLDPAVDSVLGGGIPPGYVTEVVGESGAGKTQFLLCLLLACQLPSPYGLSRPSLYISTEAPLPTSRLNQMLATHSILQSQESPPSLSRILGIQTPDLESQEHIITYQLPIAIARHNVGLVVIDSIAANYRAERSSSNAPAALAERSGQLSKLGSQLQGLARRFNCAIVVANQVADRFVPVPSLPSSSATTSRVMTSSPHQPPSSLPQQQEQALNPLSLDHQLRFFSGWGSDPRSGSHNLKSPSLGLVWANQIACRLVLIKEASRAEGHGSFSPWKDRGNERADWAPRIRRRWLKVAFAAWANATEGADEDVEFKIWAGGIKGIGVEEERSVGP